MRIVPVRVFRLDFSVLAVDPDLTEVDVFCLLFPGGNRFRLLFMTARCALSPFSFGLPSAFGMRRHVDDFALRHGDSLPVRSEDDLLVSTSGRTATRPSAKITVLRNRMRATDRFFCLVFFDDDAIAVIRVDIGATPTDDRRDAIRTDVVGTDVRATSLMLFRGSTDASLFGRIADVLDHPLRNISGSDSEQQSSQKIPSGRTSLVLILVHAELLVPTLNAVTVASGTSIYWTTSTR
jgi:hypothetical protein